MAVKIEDVKNRIFDALCRGEAALPCCKPIYIDGIRYKSLFVAGIDSDISFYWLSLKMTESQGAPVLIKGHLVVLESWVREHPECLF